MIGSRGCPYTCIYCGLPVQKKFKTRGIPNMIEEFQELENQGYEYISFSDDIFTIDNESEIKELKSIFMVALEGAIKETEDIRLQEGNNIRTDLSQRLDQLIDIINKIKNISVERREENFQKYRKIIIDLMAKIDIDENRIYQEAAIVAEKKDITEEIVRFNSHIDLFSQYMNSKENEGKKLNFLLQEMNREVNTIGSKTNFVQISHLVVQLKAELEKMREQVQNII